MLSTSSQPHISTSPTVPLSLSLSISMEKLNVESFSHVPFIRHPKDKNPKPIRIFGKYFTGQEDNNSDPSQTEEQDQTGDNGKENKRSFLCQYCFRNFPTSQALGGHQNAHKRERQLAKRGVSSYYYPPYTSLYGYRHYPTWINSSLTTARSYGGYFSGHQSSAYYTRPSYGARLGHWRVPRPSSYSGLQGIYNASRDFASSSNASLLLLAGTSRPQPPLQVGGLGVHTRTSSYRYGLNQDHVNLDLHL